MVYKRKRARKRKYRKKRKANSLAASVVDIRRKCKSALPLILRNNMKWSDYVSNTGLSALGEHVWRVNSTFDIDYTTAGATQPPSYNELVTLYGLNTVNNVKCRFQLQNQAARSYRVYFIASLASTTTQNDPTAYELTLHPGYLGMMNVGRSDGSDGNKTKIININVPRMLRKLNFPSVLPAYYGTDLWASANADPARHLYMKIYVQAIDENASLALSYDYSIDFTQDVTWANKTEIQATGFD